MTRNRPWYDAFSGACMSFFWLGGWPPGVWYPYMYGPRPNTVISYGRDSRGTDLPQEPQDAARHNDAGRARART